MSTGTERGEILYNFLGLLKHGTCQLREKVFLLTSLHNILKLQDTKVNGDISKSIREKTDELEAAEELRANLCPSKLQHGNKDKLRISGGGIMFISHGSSL